MTVLNFEWSEIKSYVAEQLTNDENWELAVEIVGTEWKSDLVDRITEIYKNGIYEGLSGNIEACQEINIEKEYISLNEFLTAWLDENN